MLLSGALIFFLPFQQLKLIRHPSILHYISTEDEECGPYLMTESVVPLSNALQSLCSLEICAGLQNVLEGLAFLHDKVKGTREDLKKIIMFV